ncbi:hypothetical protein BCR37DRAFT_395783 [Protomyces lactucae-debilis]|uniref:Ell binding protein Ebp1 C-terminal domain-containing protein n=1 Tax=Protomyces lactucae-debilis TaxID=2754530 RepID=A0A1Y2EU14_PROLT|nr:uncharacterized protein BCR37DRAFT_395783 [Protomyces lactucae-debilis]ORY74335.1 hypothetical protein BCR37DRAFT_395783 [Protomyces lactucae-debilis]
MSQTAVRAHKVDAQQVSRRQQQAKQNEVTGATTTGARPSTGRSSSSTAIEVKSPLGKRKRGASEAPIELLSPSLPPLFERALAAREQDSHAGSSPPPLLLSPTLPPKFAKLGKEADSPDASDLLTSATISGTPKSDSVQARQERLGTGSTVSATPARKTDQDPSALSKLMSTRGRECKHAAQEKSPHSKLYGVDAVLCFLAQYHFDEQIRIRQNKAPSLALIRSFEDFLVWVSCLKVKTKTDDILQLICHLTLAAMHYHIGRTEQKHAKLLLKSVDASTEGDVTIKRDLFDLLRKSVDSSERALVFFRKTGGLLELPYLKEHFSGTFTKLQEPDCLAQFVYPIHFSSPVRDVINFCRTLLEELPEVGAIGGLKSVALL